MTKFPYKGSLKYLSLARIRESTDRVGAAVVPKPMLGSAKAWQRKGFVTLTSGTTTDKKTGRRKVLVLATITDAGREYLDREQNALEAANGDT